MTATVKQRTMIDNLIRERDVPSASVAAILQVCADPASVPKTHVSPLIEALLKRPKKARAAAARAGVVDRFTEAGIPDARYVLDKDALPVHCRDHLAGNMRGFYEVKTFRATRYLRQLHGAPGSYTKTRLPWAETEAVIAAIVAVTPLAATQAYAAVAKVCSCCGSDLTQDDSIRLGMGPVCRVRFGL